MNKKIADARESALDILKPTQTQLEHGLKLHKESVVVESYGFAPRADIDTERYSAAIEAGASPSELGDIWEDGIMTRMALDEERRREYAEAWDAAGVTCVLQNAGKECNHVDIMLKRLARFTYSCDLMRNICPRAACPDDIVRAKEKGRHCLYMTSNGVPLSNEWQNVEEELRFIRIFFQLGVRMMHLTYNRANMIGFGCGETNDGGLTDFGRHVVAEMNRQGVIVDVAHSGHQTSLEAAQVSERPIVASHTVAHALSGHYRGKPDSVIKAIADTDGLIGVCCVQRFLGGSMDIAAFLDHIDHLAKVVGTSHIAIGTDVAYEGKYENLPKPQKVRKHWRSLWPEPVASADPTRADPRARLSLSWTNWPMFTVGLVQRGYSDDDIQKILGGNVLRVARSAWDTRDG
jgi:membrane dipeptidase